METYSIALWVMAGIAVLVFICLFFVKAGYGIFNSGKWGPSIGNRTAWVLMEAPAFLVFAALWIMNGQAGMPAAFFGALFLLHYGQRSFIFPFLMRGRSRMPVVIMLMGIIFNSINASLIAAGLFNHAPEAYQEGAGFLLRPAAAAGVLVFFAGMAVNIHSDHVIRNLRKPGDTRHYLPQKGAYRLVTSGNYFGELLEWTGFAIATALPASWLFVWWTFANLAPRAVAINRRYRAEFGDQAVGKRRCIIPYIF